MSVPSLGLKKQRIQTRRPPVKTLIDKIYFDSSAVLILLSLCTL